MSEPAFVLRARMQAEELEWLERGEARLELEGDAVEAGRHETRAGLPPRAEVSVRYRDVTIERFVLGAIALNDC